MSIAILGSGWVVVKGIIKCVYLAFIDVILLRRLTLLTAVAYWVFESLLAVVAGGAVVRIIQAAFIYLLEGWSHVMSILPLPLPFRSRICCCWWTGRLTEETLGVPAIFLVL